MSLALASAAHQAGPRIQIILAGDSHQRKKGIAHSAWHASARRPFRCGVAVSMTGQTGQSDEIHSPEAWRASSSA